ncbi:hypothetical protein [Metabacillus sp. RGM 3146]|uniref:hypothetical protein n=1 Tax=Metabacillus sp. RGM 3146 TaxID=3401092 RepID=UPI003B9B4554
MSQETCLLSSHLKPYEDRKVPLLETNVFAFAILCPFMLATLPAVREVFFVFIRQFKVKTTIA